MPASPESKKDDYPETEENPSATEGNFIPAKTEVDVASKPSGTEPPNGGLRAWLVVLGAWCTSFCSFGWLNSIGVFQEYYQNELLHTYPPSTIAWIPSLQIFFMLGLGPFVGAIYDRHGPRYLILAGSFLHIFGIMMASLGTKYYQIMLAQGFCSAIGLAAIFSPAVTTVSRWFTTQRGAAFGILFTGSSIGAVVLPIMISHFIRTIGFGWAMRIAAFLMLALLIIANLTIRAFQPPRPSKITFSQLLKPWTEIDYLLLAVGFFCFNYGYFIPVNYLPAQALSAGMSPHLVQYLVAILNSGSLFGRLFSGFAADKFGHYNMFIIACYMTSIWILGLWLPGSTSAALVAFAALFGFFSGAYIALITPLMMKISPISELGFRSGLILALAAFGSLTTNPVGGAIIEGKAGWNGAKILSGVFCVVGTSLILALRVKRTGFRLLAKF